ncbi:AraC family transcriptional regulator ligand-binding domain-containing protein [Marinobacterium aestuariivivens]|uniref:AraC family transcriptional regulator ligand-binding domain-containing protein n=1 Tax=Marinobacterium aestuariivivens TaxID=1698799 RepID=A0ABW2A598_9GAMM
MATADTLAQALQCLADYLPLLIEGVQLRIERGREDCELSLEGACGDHLALWLLACLHSWSRQLTGTQIPPSRVEFSFETGADTAPYRQFFAAEVRFESPEARLVLPSRYLDRPCRTPTRKCTSCIAPWPTTCSAPPRGTGPWCQGSRASFAGACRRAIPTSAVVIWRRH